MDEPSDHPKHSMELARSGGADEGEFRKIGLKLLAQDAIKEKKYDLE